MNPTPITQREAALRIIQSDKSDYFTIEDIVLLLEDDFPDVNKRSVQNYISSDFVKLGLVEKVEDRVGNGYAKYSITPKGRRVDSSTVPSYSTWVRNQDTDKSKTYLLDREETTVEEPRLEEVQVEEPTEQEAAFIPVIDEDEALDDIEKIQEELEEEEIEEEELLADLNIEKEEIELEPAHKRKIIHDSNGAVKTKNGNIEQFSGEIDALTLGESIIEYIKYLRAEGEKMSDALIRMKEEFDKTNQLKDLTLKRKETKIRELEDLVRKLRASNERSKKTFDLGELARFRKGK